MLTSQHMLKVVVSFPGDLILNNTFMFMNPNVRKSYPLTNIYTFWDSMID